MILFALVLNVLNLIVLIINLVLVSITLVSPDPKCVGDILPTVIFLLSINILVGIATLTCSDKPWDYL